MKLGNTYKDGDWMVIELDNQEQFNFILDKFYKDKVWISSDGDWDIYYLDYIQKDSDDEDFWHNKTVIYVDPKNYIIKTKELLSEPVYKVREPELSMEQELALRTWVGKENKPRNGEYEGVYIGINDKGQAMFISPHSGNTVLIEKDGEIIL